MAWKPRVTALLSDTLRFALYSALMIDGIAIALASIHVICKVCWFGVKYFDRVWFSSPW